MLDFLVAAAQFICFLALVYGIIVTFHNWRESRQFWGDVDPILAHERVEIAERLKSVEPVLELKIQPVQAEPEAAPVSTPHPVS